MRSSLAQWRPGHPAHLPSHARRRASPLQILDGGARSIIASPATLGASPTRYFPVISTACSLICKRFPLSSAVRESETGQSLLRIKSTSAGASEPVSAKRPGPVGCCARGRAKRTPRCYLRSRQAPGAPLRAPWRRPSCQPGHLPATFARRQLPVALGQQGRRTPALRRDLSSRDFEHAVTPRCPGCLLGSLGMRHRSSAQLSDHCSPMLAPIPKTKC